MKIIKKINNNVAIGLDGNNHEIIVFGKGIGFTNIPYELLDLSKVDRTYYAVDKSYYGLIKEIPEDVFSIVTKILDVARTKIEGNLNPNLIFILADHINFAIIRNRKGMNISFPYSYELEYEYPLITKISAWVVNNINKKFGTNLPKGEITSITMHFINALEGKNKGKVEITNRTTKIIEKVTSIVESYFEMNIDKTSFNYFRFKNHLKHFVQRKEAHDEFYDSNEELFNHMKKEYPKTYDCVEKVNDYLNEEFKGKCSKEELLYLMIHLNRLYISEDCNRKGITPNK